MAAVDVKQHSCLNEMVQKINSLEENLKAMTAKWENAHNECLSLQSIIDEMSKAGTSPSPSYSHPVTVQPKSFLSSVLSSRAGKLPTRLGEIKSSCFQITSFSLNTLSECLIAIWQKQYLILSLLLFIYVYLFYLYIYYFRILL